jgi:hypothetical protein
MVIDSNRIKHMIIASIKRNTMASGRSRSVTFEDERNDESGHESDECDDYFGEPSDDDEEELEAGADHEDFSLLEQLLNERDKAEGLSPSDWKDVELGNIQVTVGEGTETVFEQFCEEEEFIRNFLFRSQIRNTYVEFLYHGNPEMDRNPTTKTNTTNATNNK